MKQKSGSTGVLRRVLRYMLRYYGPLFALVIFCILFSAVATVVAATFPQTLVDDYIVPMLNSGSRDFSGLAADITRLACFMVVGILAAFAYNRIMVNISQGTMRTCGTICSAGWSPCPSNILTPMPTAILCRYTPTTWIRCAN